MTDHMTECFGNKCSCQPDDYGHMPECMTHSCICSLLLAREQRVEEEMGRSWQQTVDVAVDYARTSTLDAAREAIEVAVTDALEALDPLDPQTVNRVLAAIDALREEPMATGGMYSGPPVTLGDGCVIPKSGNTALEEKR